MSAAKRGGAELLGVEARTLSAEAAISESFMCALKARTI
jgi:hypothetical protein